MTLYQLQIFAFNMSLVAVFDVLDICLEVTLVVEVVGGQGLQEFMEELRMVLMIVLAALLLGLSGPLIASNHLGLYLDRGLIQLV